MYFASPWKTVPVFRSFYFLTGIAQSIIVINPNRPLDHCGRQRLNYFISCGTHPKAHTHSRVVIPLCPIRKWKSSSCNQGNWCSFAWWVLSKSPRFCGWSMSCDWEDRLPYVSVSFSNEIWVGEMHLGGICKQMVLDVLKVKKDIQSEMSIERVEAVFWVRVRERRVHNWGCKWIEKRKRKTWVLSEMPKRNFGKEVSTDKMSVNTRAGKYPFAWAIRQCYPWGLLVSAGVVGGSHEHGLRSVAHAPGEHSQGKCEGVTMGKAAICWSIELTLELCQ